MRHDILFPRDSLTLNFDTYAMNSAESASIGVTSRLAPPEETVARVEV